MGRATGLSDVALSENAQPLAPTPAPLYGRPFPALS